jgi:CubicO group peptidase (beta-lactamase class C family)
MKRLRRILIGVGIGAIGLLVFGLFSGPPRPTPPSTFWKSAIPSQMVISNVVYSDAITEGRASLIDRMQFFGTPGLSVAIAIRKEVVWVECFGYSDIRSKTLVDPLTKFRVGSVSKPFTAALMAKLLEEGKVACDAPVRTYLDYPEKDHSFTIRQLGGHLAGVGRSKPVPLLNTKRYHSIRESLQEFQHEPLLFPPGARFHYSGEGYTILAAIAEAVSRKEFLSLMVEKVFHPLQMTNTCPDLPGVSNVTVFYDNYTKKDRLPVIAPYHDSSRHWAAGGFLSTPLDMVKFGDAHLSSGFLKPATVATLFTSQKTADGTETGYGIGWNLVAGPSGVREVRHLGDTVGGQAFLVLCPELELVIALSCTGNFWNYHGDGSAGATDRLAAIFLRAIKEKSGHPEGSP